MIDNIKHYINRLSEENIRRKTRYTIVILIIVLFIFMLGSSVNVKENKEYSDWEHVALYIIEFNDLPDNYVPKSQGASADEYDVTVFDIYDNTRTPVKLPLGYTYTEAYINATKDDIGEERFVFSDEQLFYTDDHYDTFEEVNRFDILGLYYVTMTLFWITIFGTSTFVLISIRWNVVTLKIIKDDFKGDWITIKNYAKEKFNLLRERIEN
jgi:uncharacterized membrane protein